MPDSIIEEVIYSPRRKSYCHFKGRKSEWRIKEDPTLHPEFNPAALAGFKRVPPIDPNVLLTNPRTCIICGVDFKTHAALQCHLAKHQHKFNRLDPVTSTLEYECINCENILSISHLVKHPCFVKQQDTFIHRNKLLHRDGSALVCILCRARLLPSRVHLIIHLIMMHSIHRDPFRCMFCQTKFLSENVMMQEAHAFECHAPVLFLLLRRACYKMVRNENGFLADPTAPFICLYDLMLEYKPLKQGSKSQPLDDASKQARPRTICTATFNTLAEFTAHILCYHGSLDNANGSSNIYNDPVKEVRIKQHQSTKIPGPTVRELLRIQNEAYQANKSQDDDDVSVTQWKNSFRNSLSKMSSSTKGHTTAKETKYMSPLNRSEQCRMCLEYFSDKNKLDHHILSVHRIEARIRLDHLAEKNQLSDQLDVDAYCSECHRIFANNFTLQIHLAVSHAARDWRHCGLCGYEFFNETGALPQYLLLSSPDPQETRPETGDHWSISPELLWRMVTTHEAYHMHHLYPRRRPPHLPGPLFTYLVNSQAIQSGMASSWLIKIIHEAEGKASEDEDTSELYGPLTAEEAFLTSPNKVRSLKLDQDIVNQAITVFSRLMDSDKEPGEMVLMNRTDQANVSKGQLPQWLLEKLQELAYRHRIKQAEVDFDENI